MIVTLPANALGSRWVPVDGVVRDVGIGSDGSIWAIGAVPSGRLGFAILRHRGWSWDRVDGAAARVAASPGGAPVVVDAAGRAHFREGERWRTLTGTVYDVDVDDHGTVWAVGPSGPDGRWLEVYRRTGDGWQPVTELGWQPLPQGNPAAPAHGLPGGVTAAIAAGGGVVHVVNAQGELHTGDPEGWRRLPGAAHDVGQGGGSLWAIGADVCPGGYGIHRWTGRWATVEGAGLRVAVASTGLPWVVNAAGALFHRV